MEWLAFRREKLGISERWEGDGAHSEGPYCSNLTYKGIQASGQFLKEIKKQATAHIPLQLLFWSCDRCQ